MPRLETSAGWSRLHSDIVSLFSPSTGFSSRLVILKTILLRSVRISLSPSATNTGPLLPLRIRPAFVILNILDLLFLGILGFHPRASTLLRLNDKLLHFVCFLFATFLFYMIWDVDEPARASYLWRNASLLLTGVTCFLVGGIGSEIVQSLLPYKEFQWGDIVANLLGSSLGLWLAYHGEKRYRARRELERLYAPLDIEDYGDLDGEDADEEELQRLDNAPGGIKSSFKSNNTRSKGKKIRFDNDIWDDSVDIDPAPSKASSSQLQDATAPVRKEDLFTIDDDDDEPHVAGSDGTAPQENVWKQGST